jgi:hypothetical protein
MPHSEPTLRDLFPVPQEQLSERLERAIESADGETRSWSGPLRQMVAAEVGRRFEEMLDITLADILSGALGKYVLLLKYADRDKYPRDESVLVPLGSHEIDSKHAPVIEVVINGTPVLRLAFSVDLVLSMKSAILRIQDARIREMRPGEANAKGSIKFGKVLIAERQSKPLKLPGSIDFGDGIPIRPSSHAADSPVNPRSLV